jgi:large subunit ribosomal protein LX
LGLQVMVEVKIFRVEGLMLIATGKLPRWQKFVVEVRALNRNQALELVLSTLGGRHKVKRANIKILKVEEIPPEEAFDKHIKEMASLTKMVI